MTKPTTGVVLHAPGTLFLLEECNPAMMNGYHWVHTKTRRVQDEDAHEVTTQQISRSRCSLAGTGRSLFAHCRHEE